MFRILLTAVLCSISLSVYAQTARGFIAQLEITDEMNFFERWHASKTPGITLRTLGHVQRNKPFQPVIFFADPGVDAKGNTDISADITIYSPDGSVYGGRKGFDCWKNLPAPAFPNLQLCKDGIGIVIEDKDLAGRYKVVAVVHDLIKKTDVTSQQYFEVK